MGVTDCVRRKRKVVSLAIPRNLPRLRGYPFAVSEVRIRGEGLKLSESHEAARDDPFSRKKSALPLGESESCCLVVEKLLQGGTQPPLVRTPRTGEHDECSSPREKLEKKTGKSPSLQQLVASEHRPSVQPSSSEIRLTSDKRMQTVAFSLSRL